MKALASSCSKAIVGRLGSSSPRGAAHVSDRPEFGLSLPSRDDKKGRNFRFLKLVQNKGICPVHAVPSKTQVELDTVEPQAQRTNEPKTIHVKFQLQKNCNFGEQFFVVGDHPMFGSWDPSNALPMAWSDGHIWTVELDLPAGKLIQFKFILKGKDGGIMWQPGSDRILHTWEAMNRITVCEDWDNAKLQKIIEDAHSNEKPQIDSQISTFAENLGHPKEELVSNVAKVSGIEVSQTHAEEKPLAEPVSNVAEVSGIEVSQTHAEEKPLAEPVSNVAKVSGIEDSQTHAEEEPLAEPVSNVAKVSGVEDGQTHAEEELLAGPDLQQVNADTISSSMKKPIVAENIGSSEEPTKSTSRRKTKKNIRWNEKSVDGPRNDATIHNLGHNGKAAPVKNEEGTFVKGNISEFEEDLILVPGLTPSVVPTEEANAVEVKERNPADTSIGAFETNNQNMPEFNKEQESSDGIPQEINAALSNEPEMHDNEYGEESHVATAMGEINSQPVDSNVLQNEIQWGRKTLNKFLTKLGLL